MADIDVQRKGPSIWPWIIGLIVLALLIWALVEAFDSEEEGVVDEPVAGIVDPAAPASEAPPTGETGTAAVPAPVQQYLTTCASQEPSAMGLDHQYTSDCIQRLVEAVDATMQRPDLAGVDAQAQMQDARQKAQQLSQSAAESTQHAGMTREAFISVATLINAVQEARYPNLDSQVSQLEESARSVQQSGDLLDQRESVQTFFRQAGDVLNGMSTPPAGGA